MTVIDLAKLLATHIAQGRGHHTVALFQWQYGSEPITEAFPRDACGALELYSGTAPVSAPETVDDTSDLV